jgi:AcrR family transcriptional regulator
MPESPDRRKARTKRLLRAALLEAVEEKGLDKVTVKDLCDRADINRGTFYLHYRDVYDMVERTTEDILRGLRENLAPANPHDLIAYAAKDEPHPGFVAVLEYLAGHADFLRMMLGPKGDPSFPLKLKGLWRAYFFEKIMARHADNRRMLVPPDYFVAFLLSAQLGILQHWLDTGMRHSPQELALFITRIVSKGPAIVTGLG